METEPEVVLEPAPSPKASPKKAPVKKAPAKKAPAKKAPAKRAPAKKATKSEPAPTPEPAPKSASKASKGVVAKAGGTDPALLVSSGNLFLEEGRVAVSLLQRRFDLDFEQACDILDELQEAGLIGPYMGGQQRDILLTSEEWLAKAPTS